MFVSMHLYAGSRQKKVYFCARDKEPERRVAHFPIHNLVFFTLSFALCFSLIFSSTFRASSGCEPIIVFYTSNARWKKTSFIVSPSSLHPLPHLRCTWFVF